MIVFGELLDATEWVGIACIAAGLALISLLAWLRARRGETESTQAPVIESG